jgi:hypothetical protein
MRELAVSEYIIKIYLEKLKDGKLVFKNILT